MTDTESRKTLKQLHRSEHSPKTVTQDKNAVNTRAASTCHMSYVPTRYVPCFTVGLLPHAHPPPSHPYGRKKGAFLQNTVTSSPPATPNNGPLADTTGSR
ncbi:hypothetical protein BaRGS_00035742 [Batillaria attramentaria]|uniref:Uncharacterized protein n=1 Tax=Batillaria attramentaria TaxID=370345 RepID=A0ABD0JDP0_9CAEN